MNWADLENFSEYDKETPCPNCKQPAHPTVAGDNRKCHECNHLFREDGSKPTMECFCKVCSPDHDPLAGKTKGKKAELQLPEKKVTEEKKMKKQKNLNKIVYCDHCKCAFTEKSLNKHKKQIGLTPEQCKQQDKPKSTDKMKFILINENPPGKEYSFTILGLNEDYFFDYVSGEDDFCNLSSSLETKYKGVLDGCGNGFSSYEIKAKDFPKVLKEFKDWFHSKGYKTK